MKRLGSLLITLATMFASWQVYTWFYGFANPIPNTHPATTAMLIISMVLYHEVGHLVMFERNNIKGTIVFLFIIDAAVVWPSSHADLERLPLVQYAKVTLAGLVGNVILIIHLCLLYVLGYITLPQLEWAGHITAFMIVTNLIPIGFLDGGQFLEALLLSVPRDELEAMEGRLIVAFACLYVPLALFWSFWAWTAGSLFCFGLHLKVRKVTQGKVKHHKYAVKMNREERELMLVCYMLLILLAVVLLAVVSRAIF